jgi:hypothetical protein
MDIARLRMTIRTLFRPATLAATTALVVAISPGLAAIRAENRLPPPPRPSERCPNSTDTIKQLALIDSFRDGGFQCLGLALDGNTVKAIRLETHSYGSVDRAPNTEQIKVLEFSRAVVESDRGAVLAGVPGYDAMILRGQLGTPSRPAKLEISYLYNGFTGEYRSCAIALDQAPETGWHLVNRFDRTISHIMVRTRQLPLIGTYGIAILEGACT